MYLYSYLFKFTTLKFLRKQKPEHLAYLTSEQALADFVDVIFHVKNYHHHYSLAERKNAVVAFGGSYGGMLAAWMRMKYPAVIQGYVYGVSHAHCVVCILYGYLPSVCTVYE